MFEIHYTDKFDEVDKIADELLTEYDTENSYYSEITISNIVVVKKV